MSGFRGKQLVEAEQGKNGGKVVWKYTIAIQCVQRGLVPVKTAVVKDAEVIACITPEAQQWRWR